MPSSTDKYAALYTALLGGSQYRVTVRAGWLPLVLFLILVREDKFKSQSEFTLDFYLGLIFFSLGQFPTHSFLSCVETLILLKSPNYWLLRMSLIWICGLFHNSLFLFLWNKSTNYIIFSAWLGRRLVSLCSIIVEPGYLIIELSNNFSIIKVFPPLLINR